MARQPDPALRQAWRELISQQPLSALSIARFCENQEISTASFYKWRRELSQLGDPQRQAFLPVEVLADELIDDLPLRARLDRRLSQSDSEEAFRPPQRHMVPLGAYDH